MMHVNVDVEKRFGWTFEHLAAELRTAALGKEQFHKERLEFWIEQKKETEIKIRSEGINFEGSLSNMVSNAYRGTGIDVDKHLVEDYRECESKEREHMAKMKEYRSWVTLFERKTADTVLELTHADWEYFFGE